MRKAALLVLFAAVLTACSSGPGALPKVPDFKVAATTTTAIDYSQVPLKGVSGHGPTTSIVLGPGQATLGGTVIADGGSVPGATVMIQRIAGGATASTTVQTAPDGTWTLPQVLGGRYRVRAWRAPDLAQTAWSASFVGSTETKTIELHVQTVGGLNVESSIAPKPPVVGEDANLVVLVTQRVVDDQGVVRATPQPDQGVELVSNGGWRVLTTNPTTTNTSGQAQWTLRCRATGHQTLAVNVGTQTIPIDVDNCVDKTAETTTTTSQVSIVP